MLRSCLIPNSTGLTMHPLETTVAIVGGGPLGIICSVLLSLQDIPHVLPGSQPDTSIHPKDVGHNKRIPVAREYEEDILTQVDAWLLGDELIVPAFQETVMLKLLGQYDEIDVEVLSYACDRLKPGNQLARFMAEEAVWAVDREDCCKGTTRGMDEDEVESLVMGEPTSRI